MSIRAVVLLLCATLVGAGPAQRSSQKDVTFVGIRAQLYYPGTGTFSRDVLSPPRFALWNTIIGAGDAEAPSNATLVSVDLQGPANTFGDSLYVRLRAVAVDQVLIDRALQLRAFGSTGRQSLAFWIYDTGCDPIDLIVRIDGQAASHRARLLFACGE